VLELKAKAKSRFHNNEKVACMMHMGTSILHHKVKYYIAQFIDRDKY